MFEKLGSLKFNTYISGPNYHTIQVKVLKNSINQAPYESLLMTQIHSM